MSTKKTKSVNAQVYEIAYKKLKLTSTERSIFQRLLGFLIRNNKPFPYSAVKLAELSGFHIRTIFLVLNRLEYLRLIKRHGMGKNRKFSPGTILVRILTTVQKRMVKYSTTVQYDHQNLVNRATDAYNKTSLSLKHKEKGVLSISEIQDKAWFLKHPEFPIPEDKRYLFEK